MHRLLAIFSIVILCTFSVQAYHGVTRIEGSFGRDYSMADTCEYVQGAGLRCLERSKRYPEYYFVETAQGLVRVRDLATGYSPWGSMRSSVYSPKKINGKFKRSVIYVRLP